MSDFEPSFDGLAKRSVRQRTTSRTSAYSSQSLRHAPPVREPSVSPSISFRDSNHQIHAPTPRRHHLLQTVSHEWLRSTAPRSPGSSRAASPTTSAFQPPFLTGTYSRKGTGRRVSEHKLTPSIDSMMDAEIRRSLVPSNRHSQSQKQNAAEGSGEAPAASWIRWMYHHGLREWIVPCAMLASILVKGAVALGSYSGENTPPMYGDYEAQRHWMELTIHLPVQQWYTYDLQYWGLDYPPVTAYVSWVCGIVGSWLNPSWFALDQSRGIETPEIKAFMRGSVLLLDAAIYLPALLMFTKTWHGTRSRRTQNLALLSLLFHPAMLLVDFGHFQYNSVMLGFALLSINFFATGQDLLGSIFFVLSLGFKQMALYYAPAIGSYLMGKCLNLGPRSGSLLFVRLGVVVISTFLLMFLPFLPPFAPISAILDPITRIFPFGRGLFEDKVANFWCASNVVFKWKRYASTEILIKMSGGLTALGFLPAVLGLVHAGWKSHSDRTAEHHYTPTLPMLPYALLTSSMSFFLFSFQVHEKTILLPLLPMTLLLSGSPAGSTAFELGVLCNNVAVFSMWPLLKRDGQVIPYVALTLLWNWMIGYNPLRARPRTLFQLYAILTYTAALTLHLSEPLITPPARYPDLFPVLNVLVSTPAFALVWVWSITRGVKAWWGTLGLGGVRKNSTSSATSPLSSTSITSMEDKGGKNR